MTHVDGPTFTVRPFRTYGNGAGRRVTAALWLTSDTTAIQVSELSHP